MNTSSSTQCCGTLLLITAVLLLATSCMNDPPPESRRAPPDTDSALPRDMTPAEEVRRLERWRMVEDQLAGRDIVDERVLEAMSRVPRHKFVPHHVQHRAYSDTAIPIGHGQTISQPYIVALMTQAVAPTPEGRALDVGTGSGYQAAVLAGLVKEVYSIEIVKPLADEARARLETLGYNNVHVRHGDGYRGWPEVAPFDVIVVAAAPDEVPQPLLDQLAPGGRMVIPVGGYHQELLLIEKSTDGTISEQHIAPVAFVRMTGEAEEH